APRNLEHDTAVGAYLVNPARRQYPLDELLEEAGIVAAADAEGEDGLAQEAAAVHALAALQRGEIDRLELRRLFDEVELPLVEVLCWMERIGVKVDPAGRLSSMNPNLQNIPIRTPLGRQIRGCFVTEGGCRLISADYSQVELRILAHVASEQVLKDIFARGEDVHAATAAEVLKLSSGEIGPGERSKAKAVNFGIVYGLSPHGLSEQLDLPP